MADHSKPTITSLYTDFVSEIAARFNDLAVGLDPAVTTATNIPTNAIRWSSAANKWQKWNGTAWVDLTTKYAIDVESVDGKSFGTFNQGGILYASSTTAAAAISAGTAGHLLASDGTGAPYWVDPNGLGVDTANMAAVANEILVSASTPSDTTMSLLLVAGQSTDYQDVYLDNALNWDATNNRLGIGTNSPDRPVHLGGAGSRNYFKAETTTNSISYEAGFEVKTPSANFLIGSWGNTNALWIYDATANAERFRIDASGNWLVGTTTSSTGGTYSRLKSGAAATIGGFVIGGTAAVDSGVPINQGSGGATMLLVASRHTSDGTATASAVYMIKFYYNGDNAPVATLISGDNFVTFGTTGAAGSRTLTLRNSAGGQTQFGWFFNK